MADLIVRADAWPEIGTGHIMRCIALAQEWQTRGKEVIFATACKNAGLLSRLQDEGFKAVQLENAFPDFCDWENTLQVLNANAEAWVVLDGYHFDPSYHLRVKESGHPLLVMDDMAHLDHYYTDILLNQNIHARHLHYKCEPYTRLLLGSRYVILRREFWPWQGFRREIPQIACRLLVTLGGGDPANQTLKVIRALQRLEVEGLEATVVIGASNPHLQELKTIIERSPINIGFVHNASNMPELMARSDVAVSAGGSTCWEMAFMGLPNVLLVLAKNQQGIAEGLFEAEIALNLGWFEDVNEDQIAQALGEMIRDHERRQRMSDNGRRLVDLSGTRRIYSAMQNH